MSILIFADLHLDKAFPFPTSQDMIIYTPSMIIFVAISILIWTQLCLTSISTIHQDNVPENLQLQFLSICLRAAPSSKGVAVWHDADPEHRSPFKRLAVIGKLGDKQRVPLKKGWVEREVDKIYKMCDKQVRNWNEIWKYHAFLNFV